MNIFSTQPQKNIFFLKNKN